MIKALHSMSRKLIRIKHFSDQPRGGAKESLLFSFHGPVTPTDCCPQLILVLLVLLVLLGLVV